MRKKKANVRNIQALVEHEKWLRKQGVHPEQLEAKKAKRQMPVAFLLVTKLQDMGLLKKV